MRAMADDHAEPNIDVEHIGVVGHALAAFYPSGALVVVPDPMSMPGLDFRGPAAPPPGPPGVYYGVSGRAIIE